MLWLEYSHPVILESFQSKTFGMRTDLILALYFLLIAVITILLTATYLLAVFELEKVYRNRISGN